MCVHQSYRSVPSIRLYGYFIFLYYVTNQRIPGKPCSMIGYLTYEQYGISVKAYFLPTDENRQEEANAGKKHMPQCPFTR